MNRENGNILDPPFEIINLYYKYRKSIRHLSVLMYLENSYYAVYIIGTV